MIHQAINWYLFLTNSDIFRRHLKLLIALAIPDLNAEKISRNKSGVNLFVFLFSGFWTYYLFIEKGRL